MREACANPYSANRRKSQAEVEKNPEGEESEAEVKTWECKIGEVDESNLPDGCDFPMREAVKRAYFEITGEYPTFLFSGWGAELTKIEREIVDAKKLKGSS